VRRAVAGAIAVALVATGCGHSAGEEFREDSLRPLQQQLERERARIAATLRVVRPRSRRGSRALGEDVKAMSRTARKIAALIPPREASEEFDAYARSLRDLVNQLIGFPLAVAEGEAVDLETVSRRVQDATGVVEQREHELEEKLADV
jgi:hypothetical protein